MSWSSALTYFAIPRAAARLEAIRSAISSFAWYDATQVSWRGHDI